MSVSLSEGGSGVIWRCWRERITMHCVCFDVICRRKLSAIEVRGIWQRYLKCGFLMMQLRLNWSTLSTLLYVNGGKVGNEQWKKWWKAHTPSSFPLSFTLSPTASFYSVALFTVAETKKNAAPTRNVVKCKGNNSKKKLLLPWEGVWNQLKIFP